MKKFTLGVLAGMSTLTLAVPLVAQVAGAQSDTSVAKNRVFTPPTQACLQAMVGMEEAHLANFDADSAKRKQLMQEHLAEMKTVAAIADDTARQEAMQKLHEAKMADRPFQDEIPAAIKTAMEAVRTACGDTMKFRGGFGIGMGPMMKIKHFRGPMGERPAPVSSASSAQ